jgi:acetyl esterase/lipase
MAPEHPFPTPTDDCFTVTKYVMENAEKLGLDKNRICVGGDSAGANAVAVVTQQLLKKKITPMPKLEILIYPWVQKLNTKLPSLIRYENTDPLGYAGIGLSKLSSWYLGITNVTSEINAIFRENHLFGLIENKLERERILSYFDLTRIPRVYKPDPSYYETYGKMEWPKKVPEHSILRRELKLAEKFRNLLDTRVSPLLARTEDLIGLPKAYFIVLEWDTYKDDGLLYAQRLKDAGVEVEIGFYEKAFHGIVPMVRNQTGYQKARDMQRDLVEYLRTNL